MSPSRVAKIHFVLCLSVIAGNNYFIRQVTARLEDAEATLTHHSSSIRSTLPRRDHHWSSNAAANSAASEERQISVPWRAKFSGVTVRNRTMTTKVTKRTSRFADFTEDDWIPIADESAPFLSPMGGLSFPLFTPNIGPEFGGAGGPRGVQPRPRSPFSSLDYDRGPNSILSPSAAGEAGRGRFSPFFGPGDPGKDRGSLQPPSQIAPPPPPPQAVASPPRYSAHGSSPQDRRYRPDRSQSPYGPYGPPGPDGGGGRGGGGGPGGKSRGKGSTSGDSPYGPGDPYYDYDGGGGGPPTYSYNPSEIPRCAKESNVSYCIEDPEYPIETMQYEIDRDASILEQIMPDSEEKMDLVEGIPKKDDEKYNFRHYFTYRLDELENQTKHQRGDSVTFGLKPDYYKDGGYICPSLVSYVQPRRARNTEGLWKVVLNLRERYKGLDYRQTVRLEQCMHPGRECSFTSSFYNSQCIQKYSNERLLAWTEERGIHLDVFKLPIACSCFFKGKGSLKMN